MKGEIKYIELKTGYNHNGPAFIGLVSFSKSRKTMYFNGKIFQKIGSDRMMGNYYDVLTGEEYWISGVKKNMSDRHVFGNGKIFLEKRILSEYLKIINRTEIDFKKIELKNFCEEISKQKFNEIENETIEKEEFAYYDRFKKPNEMSDKQLDYFIDYYENSIGEIKFLKARKGYKEHLNNLIQEKDKRLNKNKNLI